MAFGIREKMHWKISGWLEKTQISQAAKSANESIDLKTKPSLDLQNNL